MNEASLNAEHKRYVTVSNQEEPFSVGCLSFPTDFQVSNWRKQDII